MPDSKRLKILKGLTTLIEATPGYSLTGKVWRGRRNIGDESETPCVVIFELPPDEESRADLMVKATQWDIGIQGYVQPDKVHLTDSAHGFMAAVKQQLSQVVQYGRGGPPGPQYMLDGLLTDLALDGGLVFAPDETTDCCFFVVKLTVGLTEDLGDPYE